MTGWDELVTTALLGTDRRPLPADLSIGWAAHDRHGAGTDPAVLVLDLAASHRALRQAGTPLGTAAAPEPGPVDDLPLAPGPAQDVLAGLMARPEPNLINLWLAVCAGRGLGMAAELWPPLAQLASRNAAYDRRLLARVLGPRGAWFLRQNPAWVRLAGQLGPEDSAEAPIPVDPGAALATTSAAVGPAETVRLILAQPDPLPLPLVATALELIADGALGPDTRNAAVALGPRIPLEVWTELPLAMTADALSDAGPPRSAVVQLSLSLVHRAVRARSEIENAFTTPTGETTP